MAKKTYSDKLKDPRWQKVRLRVMDVNDFKCLICDRGDKTLHVHHKKYTTPNPWDEPIENLRCVCEECHNYIHDKESIDFVRDAIIEYINKGEYEAMFMFNAFQLRAEYLENNANLKNGK